MLPALQNAHSTQALRVHAPAHVAARHAPDRGGARHQPPGWHLHPAAPTHAAGGGQAAGAPPRSHTHACALGSCHQVSAPPPSCLPPPRCRTLPPLWPLFCLTGCAPAPVPCCITPPTSRMQCLG